MKQFRVGEPDLDTLKRAHRQAANGPVVRVAINAEAALNHGKDLLQQILRPETIQRATMEVGPHQFDRTVGMPLRFSQGFMLGGEPFGLYGAKSHHAYGHVGLVNNITWADPERQITVALLVSGIPLLAGNLGALMRVISRIGTACPRFEA